MYGRKEAGWSVCQQECGNWVQLENVYICARYVRQRWW